MSVTIFQKCGLVAPGIDFVVTSGEPLPWDSYHVAIQDANGNPLETDFFLGTDLQFVRTRTYNSQSKITSEHIS
jgi:hypothetical protein